MLASGIAGYVCMGYYHTQQMEKRKRIYIDAYHQGNDNSSGKLTALARKMTRRIVESSHAAFADKAESSKLQRQVTKFW